MAQTLVKTKMRFDALPCSREITDFVLQHFKVPSRNGALHLGKEADWKDRIEGIDAHIEKIVSRHFARFLAEEGKVQ